MSYFNKILGGNIPLSVVQSINGNKKNYKLKQDFSHYQIREGMEDVSMANDIKDIMNTSYGSIITKSVELNRDKVLEGLRSLITNSLGVAVESTSDELMKNTESVDSKQFELIIEKMSKIFSEQFLNEIKGLKISYDLFNLHIKLVHISGLSGESVKSIDNMSKQLALELELGKSFKVDTIIDIKQTFTDILTPSHIRNCGKKINSASLFNEIFINKLAIAILNVWETILDSIMNASTYEKLISLYSFGVAFSDAIYNLKNSNQRVIEGLLDAGNSTKLSDSTKIKDLKTIEKNIDQSKVMKGLTSMVSSAITNAVNKNSADLLRSIAASNRLSVSGASGTSFTLTNVKQTNTIEQETNANFVQQVTSKVINDIGSKLSENIDMSTKQVSSDTKKLTSDEKSSSSIGGVIDSVANVVGTGIETLGKVLQISAGNSVDQSTTKDITQEMKDTFKLDQSFKYEKNDDVKNSLQNILSTENLAKCAADTKAENAIDLNSINVSGPIVISEIDQTNVVKDVMNCAFNQTVMNDISNKIFNDYNKLIKQMIENVDTKLDEETKTSVQGDVYAAGVAGSAICHAVGDGISTAATGVGTGVSTAATGVGEGFSSAMSGLMGPLIVGAVILVIGVIGYVLFKKMGGIKKSELGGDDDDE
jgi:hypothetical protein